MDKIVLAKVETILSIVRLESFCYFVFFIYFSIHSGMAYSQIYHWGLASVLIVIITLLAFMNYICFRSNFYAKMRIQARIKTLQEEDSV
jgi:hypothetical protein